MKMTQALIHLNEHEDRVLTIVKGKYGLTTKSDAINFVIERFEQEILEPHLRPEYKNKLNKVISGRHLSREEFEKEVA